MNESDNLTKARAALAKAADLDCDLSEPNRTCDRLLDFALVQSQVAQAAALERIAAVFEYRYGNGLP